MSRRQIPQIAGELPGDRRAEPGVVPHQRDVGGERGAVGDLDDPAEEVRRRVLAVDAERVHVGERLLDDHADLVGGDLVLDRDRVGDHDAAVDAERPLRAPSRRRPRRRCRPASARRARWSGSRTTGTRRCRTPSTGTPSVSRVSRVSPMSRIDFTPADTTATEVWPSSVRSAEMSKVCWAPRCTPPSPPVTKTRMPASAASRIVAATVVAPCRAARDDVRQVADAHLGHVARGWRAARGRRATARPAAGRRGRRSSPAPRRARG